MTVSSQTTLLFSTNELIREAFDLIGVGSEGETITADMYRRGKNSLNLMILTLNADEDLWRRTLVTLPLVAGQAAYVLSPKPMRVESARRKLTLGGYETPMYEMARQTYLDQPNKTSSLSTPVSYYYDPQRDTGTLYLWPAPSAQVSPLNTIELDVLRQMFVMDDAGDTLDFPQEWQETIVCNLAVRLKLKYPVNDPTTNAEIDRQAGALMAGLKAWDQETASIYLQPDTMEWDGCR